MMSGGPLVFEFCTQAQAQIAQREKNDCANRQSGMDQSGEVAAMLPH